MEGFDLTYFLCSFGDLNTSGEQKQNMFFYFAFQSLTEQNLR